VTVPTVGFDERRPEACFLPGLVGSDRTYEDLLWVMPDPIGMDGEHP
jgi:hypothetical protein